MSDKRPAVMPLGNPSTPTKRPCVEPNYSPTSSTAAMAIEPRELNKDDLLGIIREVLQEIRNYQLGVLERPSTPLFGCPFVKHNPDRYAWVRCSCTQSGWKAGKIAEHVLRVHMKCDRCGDQLKKGDENHKECREKPLAQDQPEIMDAAQRQRFRARQSSLFKGGGTYETKWTEKLCKEVLFQDDERMSDVSPVHDDLFLSPTHLLPEVFIKVFERLRFNLLPCDRSPTKTLDSGIDFSIFPDPASLQPAIDTPPRTSCQETSPSETSRHGRHRYSLPGQSLTNHPVSSILGHDTYSADIYGNHPATAATQSDVQSTDQPAPIPPHPYNPSYVDPSEITRSFNMDDELRYADGPQLDNLGHTIEEDDLSDMSVFKDDARQTIDALPTYHSDNQTDSYPRSHLARLGAFGTQPPFNGGNSWG